MLAGQGLELDQAGALVAVEAGAGDEAALDALRVQFLGINERHHSLAICPAATLRDPKLIHLMVEVDTLEQLDEVLSSSSFLQCDVGDAIIKEGTIDSRIYILLSGELEVRVSGKKVAANTSAEITMNGLLENEGMTAKEIKRYVRFTADWRLRQLGMVAQDFRQAVERHAGIKVMHMVDADIGRQPLQGLRQHVMRRSGKRGSDTGSAAAP